MKLVLPLSPPFECRQAPEGTVLGIHVVPGASRQGIVGIHGRRLKIAVSAPPEKGKANEAVIEVLALTLRFKKPQISLLRGHNHRQKEVLIAGARLEEILHRLTGLLDGKGLRAAGPGSAKRE